MLGNEQGVGTASAAASIHSCSIEEGDAVHLSGAETRLSQVPIQCKTVVHMLGFKLIREST